MSCWLTRGGSARENWSDPNPLFTNNRSESFAGRNAALDASPRVRGWFIETHATTLVHTAYAHKPPPPSPPPHTHTRIHTHKLRQAGKVGKLY